MDWDAFFERTKNAAGVDSYSKLAPLLGITDGAIGHYRQGRRVPQVWVVAEALKIQKHPAPEKAAIEIMRAAALTSSERKFWKQLLATTALLLLVVIPALPGYAATHFEAENKVFSANVAPQKMCIMRSVAGRGQSACHGGLPASSSEAAMPTCFHCKRESDAEHYERTVHNKTALHGPWSGWRMAGRDLVSPDGDRIAPERLRGLMFRADAEARRDRARVRTEKSRFAWMSVLPLSWNASFWLCWPIGAVLLFPKPLHVPSRRRKTKCWSNS